MMKKRAVIELPGILALVAKVAGIDRAANAARLLGGRYLYIPKAASAGHPLVVACGREAADAIIAEYGGHRLDFPKSDIVRKIAAVTALAKGASLDEAVTASGLHKRSVQRLRKELARGLWNASGAVKAASEVRRRESAQIDIDDILKAS